MASRRKQPEGIALLSMYNDDEEEEDEEMEDLDEVPRRPPGGEESEPTDREDYQMDLDSANDLSSAGGDVFPGNLGSTPQDGSEAAATRRAGRGRVAIVDYGHDEVAMSPGPEGTGFAEDLRIDNADAAQHRSPGSVVQVLLPGVAASQLSEHLELSQAVGINGAVDESETVCLEQDVYPVYEKNVDPFDSFLPPPPKAKCPEELQKRIEKFLKLKKVGRSFNAEVRNRKDYRNPDFLLHAVSYQDIDQIGSCFRKEVFDPHGYDKSDYFDEIELDMRRERERREQELKKSPRVDFVSGGTQPGLVVPATKFSAPVPGLTATGLHAMQPTADLTARDGRQSKKSKWDTIKVEPDGRNSAPSGSHDSLPTAAAHAALMSANAGAGYTAYVQQKRREAEEKRTTDKKSERRS